MALQGIYHNCVVFSRIQRNNTFVLIDLPPVPVRCRGDRRAGVRQIRVTDGDLIDSIHRFNPCSRGWDARSDGPGMRGSGTLQADGILMKGKDPPGLSTNYNCI
jgi:hypothetical protein